MMVVGPDPIIKKDKSIVPGKLAKLTQHLIDKESEAKERWMQRCIRSVSTEHRISMIYNKQLVKILDNHIPPFDTELRFMFDGKQVGKTLLLRRMQIDGKVRIEVRGLVL